MPNWLEWIQSPSGEYRCIIIFKACIIYPTNHDSPFGVIPAERENTCICQYQINLSWNLLVRFSRLNVEFIWLIISSHCLSPQILKILFTLFSLHYHIIIHELGESYANPHLIQINSKNSIRYIVAMWCQTLTLKKKTYAQFSSQIQLNYFNNSI